VIQQNKSNIKSSTTPSTLVTLAHSSHFSHFSQEEFYIKNTHS